MVGGSEIDRSAFQGVVVLCLFDGELGSTLEDGTRESGPRVALWSTTAIGASKSLGKLGRIVVRASMPPADPASTTRSTARGIEPESSIVRRGPGRLLGCTMTPMERDIETEVTRALLDGVNVASLAL